jgi:hypothetical protein
LDLGAYLDPNRTTAAGQVLILASAIASLALLVEGTGRIEIATDVAPSVDEIELFPWVARLTEEDVRVLDVERLLEWLSTALAGN